MAKDKKKFKMKKNEYDVREKSLEKNSLYFGYNTRLFLNVLMLVSFLAIGLLLVVKSLDFVNQESINYTERSNLDYRVYLKENEFYEQDYLGKNMLYIASLIDRVTIDFNYSFASDEDVSLDFEYKIIGKLLITDEDGSSSYFEKEYVLLDNKSVSMEQGKVQNINQSIDIDYGYYNSVANNFKMSYGVDSVSNFIVYFVVGKDNSEEDIIISNASLMSVTMPLSSRSVDIKMDYKDINNTSNLISESKVVVENVVFIVLGVILLILSLITVVKTIRLLTSSMTKKSKYDKYINKLLTEYDRLIVETTSYPSIDEENIIKINKFQELLDVRDNLKVPIMYYVVTAHQKCYFYINHENKLYLNVVKAVDLEENNKK